MKNKTKLRILALLILISFILSSCNKIPLNIHTVACDPNEVLTVYSKQGTGLVILDVLYEVDRDCMLSKSTQELNNNCQDSTRYCSWN